MIATTIISSISVKPFGWADAGAVRARGARHDGWQMDRRQDSRQFLSDDPEAGSRSGGHDDSQDAPQDGPQGSPLV
ncbi:hypothetical protein [Cupriavidus sp. YR651]|uniref:hypothetical protein n=1 Tax=Cupriavidus sp. YR651 TaxID=1855315 RepID=UPI002100881C|nr:hypothetical protein [Cupriavidus sp. YR651]